MPWRSALMIEGTGPKANHATTPIPYGSYASRPRRTPHLRLGLICKR
jgi:hypothetical protein